MRTYHAEVSRDGKFWLILPSSVEDHLARAEVLREEAERKAAQAVAERRAAVRALLAEGLSQREAAEILGLSFQRVNQLVRAS